MDTKLENGDENTTRGSGCGRLDDALPDAREPPMPHRVGGFELQHEIGRGGTGVVYRARNLIEGGLAAVKLVQGPRLGADGDDALRLVREALALREFSNQYVVKIQGAGRQGDIVYLAMEFIDGQTLKEWQSQSTRSLREIVSQYARVGMGLSAAHDAGLVHRDFKPNNVMIDRQGQPRVLDFGLARRTSLATAEHEADAWEEITQVGVTPGTPSYMAPEQVRGESPDARADQFSFCIALYEAVTKEHPFRGRGASGIMRAIANGRRRKRRYDSSVTAGLRALIERGLSADPEARFASMVELTAELRATLV
jgi:serine/threonine protein kinase